MRFGFRCSKNTAMAKRPENWARRRSRRKQFTLVCFYSILRYVVILQNFCFSTFLLSMFLFAVLVRFEPFEHCDASRWNHKAWFEPAQISDVRALCQISWRWYSRRIQMSLAVADLAKLRFIKQDFFVEPYWVFTQVFVISHSPGSSHGVLQVAAFNFRRGVPRVWPLTLRACAQVER